VVYWKIEFDIAAQRTIKRLDIKISRMIQSYLNNRVLKANHPKDLGKALVRSYKGLWRYRVDKFRIVCRIEEDKLVILVIKIGNREGVYDD